MHKNFKIAQSISIEGEGFYYDLHNNYDFSNLQLNTINNFALISFIKTKGDWVPSENPPNLVLSFSGLEYIYFSKGFFINQSKNIEELGYKEIENENLDWLIQEDKFLPEHHLVIRFDNDEFIRIYGETVEVKQG